MENAHLSRLFLVVVAMGLVAQPALAQTLPRVDIELPPGAHGMQPSLALVYHPDGDNGMVGVGWALTGLPSIRRISYGNGINFDGNDSFLHTDLGVLILQPDGTYRTKKESFVKFIPSTDTTCRGPCSWKALYHNGSGWCKRRCLFIRGGITAGNFPEFVIPNSPIPPGSTIMHVGPHGPY